MGKMKLSWMLCLCFFALLAFSDAGMPVDQPKTNVWVTLANASGLDTICLSTTTPEKPFSTCLVGMPVGAWPIPEKLKAMRSTLTGSNQRDFWTPVDEWDWWTPHLPKAPFEPEELELLGSVKVDFCVKFNYTRKDQSVVKDVSPHHPVFKNQTFWCNYTSLTPSVSNTVPLALPRGMFFVCGDRAWSAIPSHIKGGPCSLGKLTLFTPSIKMINQMRHRRKRSFVHQYRPDCTDDFNPWGFGKRFTTSLFLPQAASGQALKQLDRLGCWLSKQVNATSLALSDLLADVKDAGHATLQNRAAIDYLLLAHGHGCKDFDGMCCMNLSDHSESIHKSIQQLREGVSKIRVDDGTWLDDLFDGWGLASWLKQLLKIGLYVLLIIIVVLVMAPCLFQCAQRMVDKAVKGIFVVQQRGGDVGNEVPETLQVQNEYINSIVFEQMEIDTCFDLRPWRRLPELEQ